MAEANEVGSDFDGDFAEDTAAPPPAAQAAPAETVAPPATPTPSAPPRDTGPAPSAAEQPGDELFGEVVNDAGARRTAGGAGAATGSAPGSQQDDVQLRDCVSGLYDMVKDLEVQLNHMISINEAAERDLEAARRTQRDLEEQRDSLTRRIDRMEQDAQSSAELREEMRYLATENERLMEQLRGEDKKAQQWQLDRKETLGKLKKSETECEDLREEVECLEAQIAQAGDYIAGLRESITRLRDGREQQNRKSELVEERLHVVTEERDALRRELNESRSALEEIKRSIMDTNIQSQLSYYES